MAAPQYRRRFLSLIQAIESAPETIIVPTTDELFNRGMELFRQRSDKSWPLTDCISFVVMEEHKIKEALTGDQHFAQAGLIPLLQSR